MCVAWLLPTLAPALAVADSPSGRFVVTVVPATPYPSKTQDVLSAAVLRYAKQGIFEFTSSAAGWQNLPTDPHELAAAQIVELTERAEKSFSNFLSGEIRSQAGVLESVAFAMAAHPEARLANPGFAAGYHKALIGCALAYQRLHKETPKEKCLAKLQADFFATPIDAKAFGPEPAALLAAYTQKKKSPSAELVVLLDDPAVEVFINEQRMGQGGAKSAALPAETLRLRLKKGATLGRQYQVSLVAGKRTTLDLSWRLDAALDTSGNTVKLRAPNLQAARALAPALARHLSAQELVLVALTPDGKRVITERFDKSGGWPTPVGTVGPVNEQNELAAKISDAQSGSSNPWKWVTLVGGAAALGAGGYLWTIHEEPITDNDRNPTSRNSKPWAIGAWATGGTLILFSGYLFWRDSVGDESPTMTVSASSDHAWFGISGKF